jgi:hypothetical protein
MEIRRSCAPVADVGDAPARSGDVQVAYGVRRDAGKTRAWTASSFAFSSEAERRL